MAIYHLNLSSGSRGGGQSAAAKLDYIEREGKYEKGKEEVAFVEHGNMPKFAQNNAKDYWQAADAHERENVRLFQQFEFALPRELNQEEQIALAREFVSSVCNEHQLPYSFAIHKGEYDHQGKRMSGEAKPHVHLVFSERQNDGIARNAQQWFKRANSKNPSQGGAAKVREIKATEWLEQQRQTWEKLANAALEKAGHDERIDHRSLEAQGIKDRLPQPKKGRAAYMQQRGTQTERIARFDEAMQSSDKLKSLHQSTFSLEEKIAQLKAEILRLARAYFAPKHTGETRTLESIKSVNQLNDINDIRTLNHIPTLEHLRKEQTHEQQPSTRNDLQELPQQRDDHRNHHTSRRTNQNGEHLLHGNARYDVASSGRTPHRTVQPLRGNADTHRVSIDHQAQLKAQQVAALIAQYRYSILEAHTEGKLSKLEEAQAHINYLESTQLKATDALQSLEQAQQDDKQMLECLQGLNFFKRWKERERMEALEKRIKTRNKTLKEQRKVLSDLLPQIAQAQSYEQQCSETLSIYALALRTAGQQERLKQLSQALRAQWQQIEQQTYQRHKHDNDILRAERSLKAQFISLQGGKGRQRTQER